MIDECGFGTLTVLNDFPAETLVIAVDRSPILSLNVMDERRGYKRRPIPHDHAIPSHQLAEDGRLVEWVDLRRNNIDRLMRI